MDLDLANSERLISLDKDNLFKAYVSSYMYIIDDNTVLANKIVSILEMKLFENCDLSFIIKTNNKTLLNDIKDKLNEDLIKLEKEHQDKKAQDEYYNDYYEDEEQIEHIRSLIVYFKDY